MIRAGSGLALPDDSDTHKQRLWDKAVVDAEFSQLYNKHLESSKVSKLSVCHKVRDLGIVVSDCLSPSAHVADVVSRGHRRAALILRAFTSQDVRLLLRAFIS